MPRKARRRAWGSVTEAARGKKYVLRWVENTPQGRRRRSRTMYGTYREACNELAKIQATKCDERAVPTIGSLFEARYLPWLERRYEDSASNTKSLYLRAWKNHCEPKWARVPIDQVKPLDVQEWLDGINELLTDEGILKNGSKFENISVFQNGSLTNILFPFEDGVEIDMGKLAMWRLHSHEQFGGTWLSDYVPNKLGGFVDKAAPEQEKPDCKLIGEDGNIFNLMGLAARTLRHNGLAEQVTEMTGRIHECGSYDEALCIIGEYVNITGSEKYEDEDEGMGMRL